MVGGNRAAVLNCIEEVSLILQPYFLAACPRDGKGIDRFSEIQIIDVQKVMKRTKNRCKPRPKLREEKTNNPYHIVCKAYFRRKKRMIEYDDEE